MVETHRPHRSPLGMVIFSALLLGALTVLGVAVLPQQFAHAAATPKGATESADPAKPKAKVVKCSLDPRVDPIFEYCYRTIAVGDIVSVQIWVLTAPEGEEERVWMDCKYEFKADVIGDPIAYGRFADGIVVVASGDACKVFKISKGQRYGVGPPYLVDKNKSRHKKK